MTIQNKFANVSTYLNNTVFEMEDEIRSVLALLVVRQHGFFLGVPGVGKSYLINKLANDCLEQDVNYFQKLVMASTTPQEIFGPINVQSLTKTGELEFNTKGYLPTCHVAFMDEMFKGNSQTLNSNLTAMNERKFHNGSRIEDIPLVSMFAASNELPADESLGALWDRFTVRMVVTELQGKQSFMSMIKGSVVAMPDRLTLDDLDAAYKASRAVLVDSILDDLYDLRMRIKATVPGLYVSDRRWKQVVGYLQGLAFLDGASEVVVDYFAEIGNCLWDTPEQQADINAILADYVSPSVNRVKQIFTEAVALFDAARQPSVSSKDFAEMYAQLKEYQTELDSKLQLNPDKAPWITPILEQFNAQFKPMRDNYLASLGI